MADESDAVRGSADSSGAEGADESSELSDVQRRAAGAGGAQSEDERYVGATPPGYDWPTHGGYLGCLLGLMAAVLVAPLGYILFGFLGAYLARPLGGVGVALAILVTVVAYLAVFIALTRLGWYLGKRFLREYEQPARPVWGEDDDEDEPLVVEADPPTLTQASEATQATEASEAPEAVVADEPAHTPQAPQASQVENAG